MKTKIIKAVNFVCMILVLGTQALLQGSWQVEKTKSLQESRPHSR